MLRSTKNGANFLGHSVQHLSLYSHQTLSESNNLGSGEIDGIKAKTKNLFQIHKK